MDSIMDNYLMSPKVQLYRLELDGKIVYKNNRWNLMAPFSFGFKREIVHRKDSSKFDVYYYDPNAKKLRSYKDVERFLFSHKSFLNVKNFTFMKRLLSRNNVLEVMRFAKDIRKSAQIKMTSDASSTTEKSSNKVSGLNINKTLASSPVQVKYDNTSCPDDKKALTNDVDQSLKSCSKTRKHIKKKSKAFISSRAPIADGKEALTTSPVRVKSDSMSCANGKKAVKDIEPNLKSYSKLHIKSIRQKNKSNSKKSKTKTAIHPLAWKMKFYVDKIRAKKLTTNPRL